jgi:hypothetical protein
MHLILRFRITPSICCMAFISSSFGHLVYVKGLLIFAEMFPFHLVILLCHVSYISDSSGVSYFLTLDSLLYMTLYFLPDGN